MAGAEPSPWRCSADRACLLGRPVSQVVLGAQVPQCRQELQRPGGGVRQPVQFPGLHLLEGPALLVLGGRRVLRQLSLGGWGQRIVKALSPAPSKLIKRDGQPCTVGKSPLHSRTCAKPGVRHDAADRPQSGSVNHDNDRTLREVPAVPAPQHHYSTAHQRGPMGRLVGSENGDQDPGRIPDLSTQKKLPKLNHATQPEVFFRAFLYAAPANACGEDVELRQ